MQLLIRDVLEADLEQVMQVHLDCVLKSCSSHYSQDQVQKWARALNYDLYAAWLRQGGEFLLVEDGASGRVVAFAHMLPNTDSSSNIDFEISKLYVSPEACRKGVGKRLYRELERRALREGGCSIGLKSSLNAVPFYEACGMELTGVESLYEAGEALLECKHMVKFLLQEST